MLYNNGERKRLFTLELCVQILGTRQKTLNSKRRKQTKNVSFRERKAQKKTTKHHKMANTRFVPWHSWEEWGFVRDAFHFLSSKSIRSSPLSSRRSRFLRSTTTTREEKNISCEDEKKNQRTIPLPLPLPTNKVDDGKEDDEEEEDQEKSKRRALEIVQMWRVRGRVPLAIDAHAQIVELQLMDEEVMRERRRRNESTLRLSYAMTLTRLVNGICDPSQKGKFALSVQTLATQLNVPRTLVDIRHDSTHNQLPSIQRLRKASEDAIGWLDANYWERQKRKLEHVTEEMRLVIRAMVECERGQNVKKSKDESNSSDDDESMYDSEEEMHAKTEKANKMKREKETRKKTKNSAVGRLKRLVPRSKPDRMLVQAFVQELLDAKEEIVENSSYDKTDPDEDLGEKHNTDAIVRAFSNVIDQIDSRVVNGFSCAILEFGTEELLYDLANDTQQIINPIFEFAWKHAVSRDVAKATFIAEWYQRRGNDSVRGANTSEYVQNKFQTLLSSDGVGGAIAADGGGSKNKKKNAKTQNNNKKRQKEEEDTIAWRKAKPGEWIPGAPIGAPIRALFPPRELGDEGDDEKIVLESDAFTPRKKQKMEQGRDTNFLTTRNEELALDLEYNDIIEADDTEDDTENEDEQPNSVLLREDEDEFDDDKDEEEEQEEEQEEEEEEEAKAKVTVNGSRVRLNSREVNGVKESVACLL